jgi:hypothetical protein
MLLVRAAPGQADEGEPETKSVPEAPEQRRCTKAARGLRPVVVMAARRAAYAAASLGDCAGARARASRARTNSC